MLQNGWVDAVIPMNYKANRTMVLYTTYATALTPAGDTTATYLWAWVPT